MFSLCSSHLAESESWEGERGWELLGVGDALWGVLHQVAALGATDRDGEIGSWLGIT